MPSPYHAIKQNRGIDEQVKLPCLPLLPQAGPRQGRYVFVLAKDTTPCKPTRGERERLRMVMRTEIKEIIATGGKIGMRGDFFVLVDLVAGLFCSS